MKKETKEKLFGIDGAVGKDRAMFSIMSIEDIKKNVSPKVISEIQKRKKIIWISIYSEYEILKDNPDTLFFKNIIRGLEKFKENKKKQKEWDVHYNVAWSIVVTTFLTLFMFLSLKFELFEKIEIKNDKEKDEGLFFDIDKDGNLINSLKKGKILVSKEKLKIKKQLWKFIFLEDFDEMEQNFIEAVSLIESGIFFDEFSFPDKMIEKAENIFRLFMPLKEKEEYIDLMEFIFERQLKKKNIEMVNILPNIFLNLSKENDEDNETEIRKYNINFLKLLKKHLEDEVVVMKIMKTKKMTDFKMGKIFRKTVEKIGGLKNLIVKNEKYSELSLCELAKIKFLLDKPKIEKISVKDFLKLKEVKKLKKELYNL